MKTVSIEYAHIYTNAKIGEEHELSLKALEDIKDKNQSLVVLVDDYSFPDPTFDYESFTGWLAQHGHAPNVVLRESQLIPLCDQTLALLNDESLRSEITAYVRAKKYPCSLFIAAWYLLRLGKLRHSDFPESEYASSLVNILPESFRPFEEKAFEIIRATPYSELANKTDNRYLKGRSI
jgi:hypothetical protein